MYSSRNGRINPLIVSRITPSWQSAITAAYTDRSELLARLELPAPPDDGAEQAMRQFTMLIPPAFADRIEPGDPADPLLRQVLPVAEECVEQPGFATDPLHEGKATPSPGLLQKYQGRALLVLTGACAIHCRYCFRRHYPYRQGVASGEARSAALGYLAQHREIHEVILSGGDPLLLTDRYLGELLAGLEAIPHLQRLRIHSRVPVVLPERITPPLLDLLLGSRLQRVLVIHCNHPRELSPAVNEGLQALRGAGITLLNQSVLLRGVNDRVETLTELSESLFAAGVLPYYLHMLDRVQGAAHFEVGEQEARGLIASARARLPGYLVPQLVREVPEAPCKTPLSI